MQNTTRLQAIIERIKRSWTDEEAKQAPGVYVPAGGGIDDGQYGDPATQDNRPDFVKADSAGWETLGGR